MGRFVVLLHVVIYLYWTQRMGDASLFLAVFGSTILVCLDSFSKGVLLDAVYQQRVAGVPSSRVRMIEEEDPASSES